MRKLTLILLTLAGCTGGHQQITGNAQGGVMPWHATNERAVFGAAQAHCARYGKDARITQIVPRAGGSVSFECVKG